MLEHCNNLWGGFEVRRSPIDVGVYTDVLYSPFSQHIFYTSDPEWGIYSRAGDLIEAAALRQGADRALVGQRLKTVIDDDAIATAPDLSYIYGGVFNPHYGHFICSTLARLWYLAQEKRSNEKVIFHSHQDVAFMMSLPFVQTCFNGLGLTGDVIEVFNDKTYIKSLIVPSPSFEEQSFIHEEFRKTCRKIGEPFLDENASSSHPVYLSKTSLPAGVAKFSREELIEDKLRSQGVEIVYPEQQSFANQVRLFSQRRTIMGTIGSAFHTSIFSPPRARLICLAPGETINSNFHLLDVINGTQSTYLHSLHGTEISQGSADFLSIVDLAEPEAVAESLSLWLTSEAGGPTRFEAPAAPPKAAPSAPDNLPFAMRNTMREQIDQYGWSIGEHTYGTPLVLEPTYGTLKVGRFCSIAMNVTVVLANHRADTVSTYPFRSLAGLWPGAENAPPDHEGRGGVQIGSDVWIGFGAVVLPGARIGDGCVIGAGAVVSGSIPPYAIVAGNPGRVVRMRFDENTIDRLRATAWWNWEEPKLLQFMPVLASGDPHAFLAEVEQASI